MLMLEYILLMKLFDLTLKAEFEQGCECRSRAVCEQGVVVVVTLPVGGGAAPGQVVIWARRGTRYDGLLHRRHVP